MVMSTEVDEMMPRIDDHSQWKGLLARVSRIFSDQRRQLSLAYFSNSRSGNSGIVVGITNSTKIVDEALKSLCF
jgi:hypothetical protein